jgi:hypothetical protein
MDLGKRVVRSPRSGEPVRAVPKILLKDGFKDQLQRWLHDPVDHRWYAEPAQLPV